VTNTNNSVNGTKTASANSGTATITVNALVNAQSPTKSGPVGATYTQNATASAMSVSASVSDGGTLSYQWYMGGSPVGTNSSSYMPSTATVGSAQYYVVVTNTNNSVNGTKTATATSGTVTITVNPSGPMNAWTPNFHSELPADWVYSINLGQGWSWYEGLLEGLHGFMLYTDVYVTDGGTLTYQWYRNGTLIPGATSSSYSTAPTTPGDYTYYVLVTNTNNNAINNKTASAMSRTAHVTVDWSMPPLPTTWW
jgi:hypothetical protein